MIEQSIGDTENSSYDSDYDNHMEKLKDELKEYQRKNEENKMILAKLKLEKESLSSKNKNKMDKLLKVKNNSKVNNLSSTDLTLAILENDEKRNKIKDRKDKINSSKTYLRQLIEDTKNEIEKFKTDDDFINKIVDKYIESSKEIQTNLTRYKDNYNEIIETLESDKIWLKKLEYGVENIHEEIKNRYAAEDEKAKLQKKVKFYEGLDPDILLAKHKLAELKEKYETTKSKLSI